MSQTWLRATKSRLISGANGRLSKECSASSREFSNASSDARGSGLRPGTATVTLLQPVHPFFHPRFAIRPHLLEARLLLRSQHRVHVRLKAATLNRQLDFGLHKRLRRGANLLFVEWYGLERLPAGIHPFGTLKAALRLAVMDNSRFGLVVRTPTVFRGVVSDGLRRRGYHVHSPDTLRLDLGGRFILDGEAFPAGRYQLSLGPKLRFVVP